MLIPLWIALSVAFIFMLYAVVVAAILMKAGDNQSENRHVTVYTALSYVFIVIPVIVYAVSFNLFIFLFGLREKRLCF